ncbi:MAG: VTT domain-containing protein [Myxococcota bacterium]|nr:VTT domain-containing protein [Myxococcota bacterium]
MSSRWRLTLLVLVLGGLYLAGRGAAAQLSVERLRALCSEAGAVGVLIYISLFAVGELLHVPGVVFIVAAVLGYGQCWGGILGYLGALCSVSLGFVVVRAIGGQALAAVQRPLVRRALAHLGARPVRTVALLRLMFFVAPPLNALLALSGVRYRHYLLGSALGIVLPTVGVVLLCDQVTRWLQR